MSDEETWDYKSVHVYDTLEEFKTVVRSDFATHRILLQDGASIPTLYHYTDEYGLRGILRRDKDGGFGIWATHYAYLNDVREMVYAADLMSAAIRKRRTGQGSVSQQLLATLLTQEAELLQWYDAYVACFCEEGDLLSQWRGYGARGGGYSLGLQAHGIKSLHRSRRYFFCPIIYESDAQTQAWDLLVDAFIEAVDKTASILGMLNVSGRLNILRPRGKTPYLDVSGQPFSGELNLLVQEFMAFAARLAMSMKNHVYHEEREWRLIHLCPHGSTVDVEFRHGRGYMTPYKELPLYIQTGDKTGNFSFVDLVIGPNSNKPLAYRSLEMLLESERLTNFKPCFSEIPGS